ncbi:hypothetical protein [Streptomyces sp. NBC_01477]|uniref:hypothetical protein n=1 Tax=Streptomyces sp. NBC_01477 TaxID=2976015 RepID=UPI002E35814B|nr:hypothetical protein [Streptomyces sp. NBC_01477]
MTTHWHAYSYTGHARPPDSEARDPHSAAPPLVVAEWLRKPRSMLVGTFADPDDAVAWLAHQLADTPPMATSLPVRAALAYARDRLTQKPGDQVTRYYTSTAYVVRDLIRCTGQAGTCPGPP